MKTIGLILFGIIYQVAHGQKGNTSINILLGHNFSNLKINEDVHPLIKNLPMYTVDFLHRSKIKNAHFIEFGLRIQTLGNKLNLNMPHGSVSYKTKVTTFSIPLTFNYQLEFNKLKLFPFVGMNFSYMSAASFTNNEIGYTTNSKFIPGVKYSLTAGLKLVPKFKNERFGLMLNYSLGCTTFLETETTDKINGLKKLDINNGSNICFGVSCFF